MNISRLAKIAAIVVLGIAVTACGTSRKSTGDSGAEVVEQGIGADENAEIDSARTRGIGDSESFAGNELDAPSGDLLSQRVIYFDYDSDSMREEYRPIIEAHARYLASRPDSTMTLEGHADERGSREYNLALGERRAMSIRRQLVLLGASANQVRTVSYGEERPVAEGHDEASYQVNRRVEIIY
ncbi:MAG: peptidoglycan-associated lipoprotein Pal [Gammaproteobacteria bacterium]|nr:peptidoglycan-associated lipoprotein Pal [Gammaproteobacteria bacterium]